MEKKVQINYDASFANQKILTFPTKVMNRNEASNSNVRIAAEVTITIRY